MEALLTGGAQMISLGHHGDLLDQQAHVSEGEKQESNEQGRNVELSERAAKRVECGRCHQQERSHERQDALDHQGQHGDHAAAYCDAADRNKRCLVKEGIEDADRHDQRKDIAELVKAAADRDPAYLIEKHRNKQHHNDAAQLVFPEGYHENDIKHRKQQLHKRMQTVDKGVSGSQLVHLSELPERSSCFTHLVRLSCFFLPEKAAGQADQNGNPRNERTRAFLSRFGGG